MWPASVQIKCFWLLCFLVCRPVLCVGLCLVQSNFKPFSCSEGLRNIQTVYNLFPIIIFNSVGPYSISFFEECFFLSYDFFQFFCSIWHKTPWLTFCYQIVLVWVRFSPSLTLVTVVESPSSISAIFLYLNWKIFPSEVVLMSVLI